ncbi:MAG: hypothetical protein ACP5TL_03345 [Candidatus Micrarchaeia archaeon]
MAYQIRELSLSIITLLITIAAIIIFLYQGGSIAFYMIAVIAIIIGFVNAWLISKSTRKENVQDSFIQNQKRQQRRKK